MTDDQAPIGPEAFFGASAVGAPAPDRRLHMARRRLLAKNARRDRYLRFAGLFGAALVTLLVLVTLGPEDLAGSSHDHGDDPIHPRAVVLSSNLRASETVPGRLGAFSWPKKGESAIAVLGTGVMARSPRSPTVPIASLTKMMTAYIILKDHPLTEGEEGPTFTMTSADVAGWIHADQNDQSNVPVVVGEHLTEHQLLEALLIPSADNIANLLATWDAGSVPAFVAKMNATASALGLRATHYADANGVNPGSRSDATDQAVLAAALMQNPVVRGIVSKPQLAFPVAGTVQNYNPALGIGGVIGVKSGFTSEAQGCLTTAAYRSAGGHSVLVVAVTLGQPGGLGAAARVDVALTNQAGRSLVPYAMQTPPTGLGDLVSGSVTTPLTLSGALPTVIGWPGLRLHEQLQPAAAPTGSAADPVVGSLVVFGPLGALASAPVSAPTPAPTGPTGSPVSGTSGASSASG